MNYITCVDEIIKDARKKIENATYLEGEDLQNLSDYLRQRIDYLLADLEDELNAE